MDASGRKPWLRAMILVGIVYPVVGIVFPALANSSASNQVSVRWRLAAWLVSGAVYAAHIGYEHFRLGNSPRSTALHAAGAVAVGAFALAVQRTFTGSGSPQATSAYSPWRSWRGRR